MYRFLLRPKWIVFHLVVLAAMIAMLGLARWQWNRHLERDAFVSKVEQRLAAEPVALAPLLDTDPPSEIEYRTVTGSGHYLSAEPFVEILQTRAGVNGVNVVSLFQIDGGPVVVVNRGFIADGAAVPDPPDGTLLIGGTARTSEIRRTGQLTDNDDDGAGNELRRIDLDVIERRSDVDVSSIYIDFKASSPASEPPPNPVLPPDLSGGPPHVSYTVQWCIFSVAVGVGWVFAVRRTSRARRRATSPSVDSAPAIEQCAPDDSPVSAEHPVQPSV